MIAGQEWLLVGAVAAVGILHTIVPDHWVPITLIARRQGWSKREVARAALVAGTGHTVSTLLIGLVVWVAGVAFATTFGNLVSLVSSIALIAFGAWIAFSSLRELRMGIDHGHDRGDGLGHHHEHAHDHEETTAYGVPERSAGRERAHGGATDTGVYTRAPIDRLRVGSPTGTTVVTKHAHVHAHADRPTVHVHAHDHGPDTWHSLRSIAAGSPPVHEHPHERSYRTTLLLILGSSPMVEGIPAFFAAGRFGPGLIAIMAAVFGIATIATYVSLCVASVAGLQNVTLGPLERYGELLSGAFIALVGLIFLLLPML